MHGTWKTTSSGGGGTAAVAALAAFIILGVDGTAAALHLVEGIILAVTITVAVIAVAAVALTIWWIGWGLPASQAKAAAERLAREADAEAARLAREQAQHMQALEQHRQKLELAAASAPQVNVTIDPAALIAAAMATQHQYQPEAQPVRVIRKQVEQ